MITARKWVAVDFGGPETLRNIEIEVPDPRPGQVTIAVRAVGMNPADAKHIAPGQDPAMLPLSLGYEVAGVVVALGPGTELASGGGAAGNEVVAQVTGGYATAITTAASNVFAKPSTLTFPEAASLLLVGTTAADLEAGDVSLALVADRNKVVTIAGAPRAKADGYIFIGASNPASGPFRARARSRILKLAEDGDLVVPMAETFGFAEAPAAFAALTSPHPPGKIALVNEP